MIVSIVSPLALANQRSMIRPRRRTFCRQKPRTSVPRKNGLLTLLPPHPIRRAGGQMLEERGRAALGEGGVVDVAVQLDHRNVGAEAGLQGGDEGVVCLREPEGTAGRVDHAQALL